MKEILRKNTRLFIGIFVAAAALLAGWLLQQPISLIQMDTLQSLTVSGVLTGITAVSATAVGIGLAARRE